jgi:hypothetical protein
MTAEDAKVILMYLFLGLVLIALFYVWALMIAAKDRPIQKPMDAEIFNRRMYTQSEWEQSEKVEADELLLNAN